MRKKNKLMIIAISAIIAIGLVACPDDSKPTLTLAPASVTINDGTLTATVTVGGTAKGAVTLDTEALPNGVTAEVEGTTITVTGVRPVEEGAAAITGNNLVVVVTREGVNQNLSVTVNLTTTWTAGGDDPCDCDDDCEIEDCDCGCDTSGNDDPCECCGEDCECTDCDDGGCTECATDPCEDGCTFTEWAVTTAATCTAAGEETEKCEVCGELGTETRPIPVTEHNFVDGKCTVCEFEEGSDPCEDGHDHTESLVCLNCDHQYALGDIGPGGGVIYHIVPAGFTVQMVNADNNYTAHYLEAAPSNATGGAGGTAATMMWRVGNTNAAVTGLVNITTAAIGTGTGTPTTAQMTAINADIGMGRKNTDLIVAFYEGQTTTYLNAARAADDYEGGTASDWFLPSIGELYWLYQNRAQLNDKDGITAMPTTGYFWSSSQSGNSGAWAQLFSDGNRFDTNKGNDISVRSVRAF